MWLEPIQALLRRNIDEEWTEKHRHVTRKLVVEGGWVQKRLYNIGWSDKKESEGCNKEVSTEKRRRYHLHGNNRNIHNLMRD